MVRPQNKLHTAPTPEAKLELSDEAKRLLAEHFEQLSRKNEETLRELNVYRWALRTFFVVLFGGSILGFLKLQDYLDDRIQKRAEDLSGIIYGSAAQSSGDPRTAIEQYNPFLEKLETPVFRPSEPIRSIYYFKFIQALADDSQVDPHGEFLAKPAFFALLDSKTYKKDLIANQRRWNADPGIMNAWGRCLAKFEGSPDRVREAKDFFSKAADISDRPSEKASNFFAMAMMSLAEEDAKSARELFIRSMDASPKSHGIKEYIGTFKNDLENEYAIWERAARILGKPGISARYEQMMLSLIAERKTK
jgi:tetratricopeptide (TPR) repeat protein